MPITTAKIGSSGPSQAIALLGAGGWGSNHIRVWAELGRLGVVCDIDPLRLDNVRKGYPNVPTCRDPDEVFRDTDVGGVVIATPAATHADLAKKALEAGKDVLVEKPMALRVAEGTELVNLAQELQRILMVGHVLEYHPGVAKLRELVASGELGRVRYINANRLNFGRIRTEESALWSFAPHDIAVLLRMLGSMPTKVACHGGAFIDSRIADVTLTHLSFPGSVQAHIYVSWLHPFKEHKLVVIGDRQMAVLDDTAPWPEKLMLYEHRVDWLEGQVPVARKASGVAVSLREQEPLRRECEAFLESMRTRRPPLTDGASGLGVLRVLDAAERSLEQEGVPYAPLGQSDIFVHPTATVDSGASLGEGTKVWHHTHVMPGAEIGSHSILGQNVFVARGVRIGTGAKIQNNVSVYEGVVIEDDVFLGPSAVFTNVRNPRASIERKDQFTPTLVRSGATIGANATVVCGVNIGHNAFVGAGAVVIRDVPSHALVLGTPARVAGWVCACGIRLNDALVCPACGSSYRRSAEGLAER